MDALDHMLTDPLDSGMDQDGRVMEECMLGNCRVRVPEDLLEDVSYHPPHLLFYEHMRVKTKPSIYLVCICVFA